MRERVVRTEQLLGAEQHGFEVHALRHVNICPRETIWRNKSGIHVDSMLCTTHQNGA